MLRLALGATVVASLVSGVGCRISLDDNSSTVTGRSCQVNTASAVCKEADNHSDLAWIETNIFNLSCGFSGCHNGAQGTVAGRLDLRPTKSFAKLVNQSATADPHRVLVVPNDVQSSYLMLMLHDFDPATATPPGVAPDDSIGFMPMGNMPLCCQKLDAIERWIEAGAPSN